VVAWAAAWDGAVDGGLWVEQQQKQQQPMLTAPHHPHQPTITLSIQPPPMLNTPHPNTPQVEIRLEMLQLTPRLVGSMPSNESRAKLMAELSDRMRDPEERVRIAACKTLFAVSLAHPGLVADSGLQKGVPSIQEAALRTMDVRTGVRRGVTAALLDYFKARIAQGESSGFGGSGGLEYLWVCCSVGEATRSVCCQPGGKP